GGAVELVVGRDLGVRVLADGDLGLGGAGGEEGQRVEVDATGGGHDDRAGALGDLREGGGDLLPAVGAGAPERGEGRVRSRPGGGRGGSGAGWWGPPPGGRRR